VIWRQVNNSSMLGRCDLETSPNTESTHSLPPDQSWAFIIGMKRTATEISAEDGGCVCVGHCSRWFPLPLTPPAACHWGPASRQLPSGTQRDRSNTQQVLAAVPACVPNQ
jgi:hypothetical protein